MSGSSQPVRSMLDVDDTPSMSNSQHQGRDYPQHTEPHQLTQNYQDAKPLPQPPAQDATHSALSSTTYALFRPETPPAQSENHSVHDLTESSHDHFSTAQPPAAGMPTQYSENQTNYNEMPAQNAVAPMAHEGTAEYPSRTNGYLDESQAQQSRNNITSHEVNAKDALAPIAGAPTYDNVNKSGGPTLKDRANAMMATTTGKANEMVATTTHKANEMMASTTEKATAIVSNAAEQAELMAIHAAEQAQLLVVDAATSANLMASNAADRVEAAIYEKAETAKLKVLANPTVQDTAEQLRENFSADSHEMARKDYGVHGAVQQHVGMPINGVRDIGWHRPTIEIPDPLIGGLPNGELFSMIRRFNKDVFDVRAVPLTIARGLDLNESWADDHATDKITLHLQRMYKSVLLGMASFGKQVARLRSWKETRRTGAFFAAYFVAWILDLLMPLLIGILIAVVSSTEARDYLFPPAPLALVNIATGGIQKPQAGQLGTSNTLTGAPEKQEGEAVEEEAANFVDNIRHLVGKAIGMHEEQHAEGDPLEGKIPKPVRNAAKAVQSAGAAPGHSGEETDLTQKPMEEILWDKANPKQIEPIMKTTPHIVGEIVDNWERFANAISPTAPFDQRTYLRIDALLVPAFLMSLFVNYYMVYKGIGFAIGFGIFGDPILTPSLQWLNFNYPNWPELVEPKNNILRGVPTNSQLTLTLLRIGEANKTPIPPVPTSKPDDPDIQRIVDVDDIPLDATDAEIHQAVHPAGIMEKSHPQQEDKKEEPPKHKKLSKIMRVLKGNTKATVETKLAVDHVRAKMGNEKAKGHLGVLPKKKNLIFAGPSEYKARYQGKKGWLYITDNSVLFSQKDQGDRSSPVIEIPLMSIQRLKRATAFSIKAAEVAADWGTQKELLGSLEIDGLNEKTWRFTALPERDELFNRLVAIGEQRWENM